jgi:hypothetical protein
LDDDPLTNRTLLAHALPSESAVSQQLRAQGLLIPSELDVTLNLDSHMSDSVQLTGTAPVRAFGARWHGSAADDDRELGTALQDQPEWWPQAGEVLQVNAVFERPESQAALVAKEARQQFYAGILLSLAASVLMWAIEVWIGPRLRLGPVHGGPPG